MKIEYLHASEYGNGAMDIEEFRKQMACKRIIVNVHRIRDGKPKEMPSADLYVFTGAHGQAHRRHAPFPKGYKVAIGNEVRHPDHRGRTQAGQEDGTNAH